MPKLSDIWNDKTKPILVAIMIVIVILLLYKIQCGCLDMWFAKSKYIFNWFIPATWSRMSANKCDTHKCPSCTPTTSIPMMRCKKCSSCKTCGKCPKCVRCGDCSSMRPCSKCKSDIECKHCQQGHIKKIVTSCSKCNNGAPKRRCNNCGSCEECDIERKCGHCQSFESQQSPYEKQRPCILCGAKPCKCLTKTGRRVIKEPGVARDGIYSSCMSNMIYMD
jgi:hypothetical protein